MNKNKHIQAWYRLVAGFNYIYETTTTCGNEAIQKHLERVLNGLDNLVNKPVFSDKKPSTKPVCIHLKQIIKNRLNTEEIPIFSALHALSDELTWEYGHPELPGRLKEKYAYSEIIGPNGNFHSGHFMAGFILLGPDCYYPPHKQSQLDESYIVLDGSVNMNDNGIFKTDSLLFKPKNTLNELRTGSHHPCLLAYTVVGETKIPNNITMEFK